MNDFEKKVKEEFDKLDADYDVVELVLGVVKDHYICDCDGRSGSDCKYPDKYKRGDCK